MGPTVKMSQGRRGVRLWGLLLPLLAVLVPLCLAADVSGQVAWIEGDARFRGGDDPSWSEPDFDDSRWQPIRVPGSWESQGIRAERNTGWYRITFVAPGTSGIHRPAILLGRIGDADETYLNGVLIGREGVVGDRMVEASKAVRLYPLPAGLLRQEAPNLLSVRVMNTYTRGGIMGRGIAIGDYHDLHLIKSREEWTTKAAELVFVTTMALFLLFCLAAFTKGIRGREYMVFTVFVLLYALSYVDDSLLFYESGLKGHIAQRIGAGLFVLLPAVFLLFLKVLYREKQDLLSKAVLIYASLLSLAFLFFTSSRTLPALLWAFFLMGAVAGPYALFVARRAYKRGESESGPVLLGVYGLAAGIAIFTVEYLHVVDLPDFFGDTVAALAAPFLLLCVIYALIVRFIRIDEKVKALSGKILVAQEEERKRVARDLHDGIGQSLLATKLNLDMMAAKAQGGPGAGMDELAGLAREVSGTIAELREISMDLRPLFLEKVGLNAALSWYARRFQERTGLEVVTDIRDVGRRDALIQDNIFRICQEALANVVRHAGATTVQIRLVEEKERLFLTVEDDGAGFDPAVAGRNGNSQGLSTMSERAELLHGNARIVSVPGEGTTVTVEVPL